MTAQRTPPQASLRIFGAPRRYVQGPGALSVLADEVALFGIQPLLLVDAIVRDALHASLHTRFPRCVVERFGGECTAEEIARVAASGKAAGCDVVIGAGGGKALDVGKGAAMELGIEAVIVPTVASNDAATSRLSVLYDARHAIAGVRMSTFNPAAVVVDTMLIAAAPRRFFVAGIGDSLSKRFEARNCRDANGKNFYAATPPLIAQALADACYDTLRAHALPALAALERRTPDESFERTVEATVLLSGLAFENGGLSIAHALTRGLSAVPALSSALHGEQVAYGLVVQRFAEGAPRQEMSELLAFMRAVGLPTSLREIANGANCRSHDIDVIVRRTLGDASHHLRHFPCPVDEKLLRRAIAAAEEISPA